MSYTLANPVGATVKLNLAIGIACLSLSWGMPLYASDEAECNSLTAQSSGKPRHNEPLPQRSGPRVKTTGRVPHTQLDVEFKPKIYNDLFRLAFLLPGIEERPTIVSLAGAKGMWLDNKVAVLHPKAIVSGREFAHIHKDGSLHAPLPYKRALELEQKGWGERHPWADRNDGWEGLVMLYSATDTDQLKTLIQLVTESYNFVTGQSVSVPGC